MPVNGKLLMRVLATASIAIAAIIALGSMTSGIDVSGIFMALGFFIPGAWWYYCESKDKKSKAEYEQRVQAHSQWKEHLDPVKDHALFTGIGQSIPEPQPFHRRWGWTLFVAFVALAISMLLTPETPATSETEEPEAVTTSETTTSSTTTSSTTATSTTSTTSTTEPTSTSSTTSSTTTQEPVPSPETQEPTEEPYVEPQPVYTPAPDPAPAPQQFVQQPVAPVIQESPSVYYQNCDAVRAAGAAPLYIGSPGYAPKLDRDGDGVACE